MKRILLMTALLFLVVALPLRAADKEIPPNAAAQGAEKQAHEVAHPDESHGEGHAAPKTYFGIPGWILKSLNLILFWGLLIYLIGGPIRRAFETRGAKIRSELAEAETRRQKAAQMTTDLEARLKQIESDVAAVLRRAEEDGERQKREMVEAAEVEAQKILNAARAEVDARIKLAKQELTDYAGQLSAERARALIEQQLTDEDRRKIFDQSVAEIAGGRS